MKIQALGEKSGMETQFRCLPGKRKTDSWINANCQKWITEASEVI